MDAAAQRAWAAWLESARSPAIDAAIRDLYTRLDAAIAAKGPTCWISGRCCNFDAYGHRMYVTALEVAWVVTSLRAAPAESRGQSQSGIDAAAIRLDAPCVYQVNGMCSVHAIRPLGCRIFFCQEGTQAWQQDLYESFLNELRSLHEAHGIDYAYVEWRAALRDAVTAVGASSAASQ